MKNNDLHPIEKIKNIKIIIYPINEIKYKNTH
jgi:hypothetical protein